LGNLDKSTWLLSGGVVWVGAFLYDAFFAPVAFVTYLRGAVLTAFIQVGSLVEFFTGKWRVYCKK